MSEPSSPSTPHKKLVGLGDILGKKIPEFISRPAEKILGIETINTAYNKARQAGGAGFSQNFFSYALKALELKYDISPQDLAQIPAQGACIVVANHPHGLSDGIIFGELLTSIRSDVKILANEQLSLCEELVPWLIQVDVYESEDAHRKNAKAVREMFKHLKNGGLLGVFPAGSASTFSLRDMSVTDDPWNSNIAAIIRKTEAPVVPLHISGSSSLLFQGVSMIKKSARVALLPRELKRDSAKVHKISVGKPIAYKHLKDFETDDAMISYLRLRTYILDTKYARGSKNVVPGEQESKRDFAAIIDAVAPELLVEDIERLEANRLLTSSGQWQVYYAHVREIPHIMREIGRLREFTFRSAGEGSGNDCDLDKFDSHYIHLFLWDAQNSKIVGAYRMGPTDSIMAKYGKKGLYNCQFFHFEDEVLQHINPALELGRAFVAPEYQKRPLSLSLIWQGIGSYLVQNPRYRYMFGTVSTSDLYCGLSRGLIIEFLKQNAMDSEMAKGVKALNPPASRQQLDKPESRALADSRQDVSEFSSLIADIEDDGKGVPVLLRQYLKLNGKILAFNIDEDFGNVLDCLIMVDSHAIPTRALNKFFGTEATRAIEVRKQSEVQS